MILRSRRAIHAAAAGLLSTTFFPVTVLAANGDVDLQFSRLHGEDVVSGPNVGVDVSFTSTSAHRITRLELLVDGQVVSNQKLEEPQRKGSVVFPWDTTSLPNAIHTITARAYDEQGKTGVTQLQLFVDNKAVDQAMPMVRVTFPTEGAVVSGDFAIQADATARSSYEKISWLEVRLDDEVIGWFNGGYTTAKLKYDGSLLSEGPHSLQAAVLTNNFARILSPPVIVIVNHQKGFTPRFQDPNNMPGAAPIGPAAAPRRSPGPLAPGTIDKEPTGSGGISANVLRDAVGKGLPTDQPGPQARLPRGSGSDSQPTFQPGTSEPNRRQRTTGPAEPDIQEFAGGWVVPNSGSNRSSDPKSVPLSVPDLGPLPGVGLSAPKNEASLKGPLPILPVEMQPTRVVVVTTRHPAPRATGMARLKTSSSEPVFAAPSIAGRSPESRQTPPPGSNVVKPLPTPVGAPSVREFASGTGVAADTGVRHSDPVAAGVPAAADGSTGIQAERPAFGSFPAMPPALAMALKPHDARTSQRPVFVPVPVIVDVAPPILHKSTRIARRPSDADLRGPTPEQLLQRPGTPTWLKVAYNEHWMNFDVPPMIVRGIPAMPFRALFERSGGTVDWNGKSKTVRAHKRDKDVFLKIGSSRAVVNQRAVQMVMPAFIRRGRTMIPIGFVRQAMDVNIRYNPRTGEIFLTNKHVLAMSVKRD